MLLKAYAMNIKSIRGEKRIAHILYYAISTANG